MLTLNDMALVTGLLAVALALYRSPRLSLVYSAGSLFLTIWGWRWERWRREQGE